MTSEIFVRLIEMPTCCGGMTIQDEDGNFNVYLNANLSEERRMKAFEHEMFHINHDDFESLLPVDRIEHTAHN